ncbi:PGF-CTERM sorting domain-containing protein [Halosimplex litoreum]|uniref:PGF-CTERM sorting domain-containing protein n=1 Tax=Halosimplex litoreum TaxID=1198301 RepID=A0A7T3FZI3_9EURY|nr:PGF-CTERM sorting domain-containing protein [Halosimplex litoreum]QPV63512.1 PGF-CTERM sorting domain-containing protein [Halosimplex litoreum]
MSRAGGRRVVVAAVAVVLLASAVTGGGLAAASPTENGAASSAADAPAPDRVGFGADIASSTELGEPAERVTKSVTASGGSASAAGTDAVLAGAPANVTAVQELRLTPDVPGEVTVVQRYRVPDRVSSLKPELPANATVTATAGFSRGNGTVYEWDGNTSSPSVTFAMEVNETVDLSGPEGAQGRYLFVDAGEWALFQRPAVPTSWSWSGAAPVGITRETRAAGEGYVGEWMAYLGAVETRERTAHGQRFELVLPERASLRESPAAILDSLAAAGDRLRVGDRDDVVNVFAAPTTTVGWGVRGLQYGDRDMWVRDAEPLATAENTWLHEYVHTRQGYETAPSARWTNEGFATYYAALLALEQDRVDFAAFREALRPGTVRPQSDAVLTEPRSWVNTANYLKGSLVAGDTDLRIRLATDGTRSLQAVFSAMNAHPGPVDARTVFESVGTVAGPEVRRAAVTYAGTERAPDLWSVRTHTEAFASTPALVEVGIATESDALAVNGPYRNVTRSGSELTLYAGETLTMTGAVSNAGGAAGGYEARFVVDGAVTTSESGTVAPGERVTYRFERTFDEAGDHTLAVGGDRVTVEVYDPAPATVTALSANRTDLSEPGAVAFTATVSSTHGVPARGNVTLRGPEGPIIDRRVALGAGENRTVSGVARLDRGEYEFTLGDADTLVVTVGDVGDGGNGGEGADGTEGGDGGISGLGPGFGPVTALAGLLGALALLVRRRE